MGYGFYIHEEGWQGSDPLCAVWSLLFPLMYVLNPELDIGSVYSYMTETKYKYTVIMCFLFYICNKIDFEVLKIKKTHTRTPPM